MPIARWRSQAMIAAIAATISLAVTPAVPRSLNIGETADGFGPGAIQSERQRQQIEEQREQLELAQQRQLQRQPSSTANARSATADVARPAADMGSAASPGSAHDPRQYRIDGIALAERATPQRLAQRFDCSASEQFAGFRWCNRSNLDREIASETAMLLGSNDGLAFYSIFYPSATFEAGAIGDKINRVTEIYHQAARVLAMPSNADGSTGMIASWGDLALVPVDAETYRKLATGQKVVSGLLVDYLGNFRETAKRGLPVYRITGGPGFFWVGRSDPGGKGFLRYGIADASVYDAPKPHPPAASVVASSGPVASARRTGEADTIERLPDTLEVRPATTVIVAQAAAKTPAPPVAPVASPPAPHVSAAADTTAPNAVSGVPDQGRRVALVIGNSAYRSVAALSNPSADAEAVAETLRSLGFSVKLVENATMLEMKDALRDFQAEADRADWALVYYAGHGIEISGQNYLIPIDARLKTDLDADDEAVTLRYVLDRMHNARKVHLVILDACRDNPFQAVMKRQIAARAVTRGLAPYEPREVNEMVVYSAKDGEEALDGTKSGHSPFAKALITRMTLPGVEINKMFRLVTADVLADTNDQQRPFVYGSTPGVDDFYFKPK